MVVVALVVGCGLAALTALHFRAHLLWRHQASGLGLHDVQAIPDQPMPESPTPKGWVRCRVGCIEFSLPPELARNTVAPKKGASLFTFEHGPRAVVVALPTDASEFSDLLKSASELCPRSQPLTMPRLRLACYQASSDDFRWSMTPIEVRWHAFCIVMSKLIRPMSDGYTESLLRKDLEGIVHFGGERAAFDWQCTDRMCGGYMHFMDHGEKTDATWIRAVVQSLKVLNEAETEADSRKKGTSLINTENAANNQ